MVQFLRQTRGAQLFCLSKHHQHHADLAFWNSGFDKSIVLVVDSQGHHVNKQKNDLVESESIYVYDRLKKTFEII